MAQNYSSMVSMYLSILLGLDEIFEDGMNQYFGDVEEEEGF